MRTLPFHLALLSTLLSLPASPLAAQEEPGQCPGTYTGHQHPACPSAETLTWIDCPATWSVGKMSKTLRYGDLYYDYNDRQPNDTRYLLDIAKSGQLYCQYGTEAEIGRYRQIVEIPLPMVQWGWHQTPQGRVAGVRVPKTSAAKPPIIHVIENIGQSTTWSGFRLGMTRGQVGEMAAAAGYSVASTDEGAITLERVGSSLTIAFDASGHSKQVTQALSNRTINDVRKELVQRFGFDFLLERVEGYPEDRPGGENISWYSHDKTIAVRARTASKPGYVDSISLMRAGKTQ